MVGGDDLVFAALLLRVEKVALHREGRDARPDRPAPQLDRRRRCPVGLDANAADDTVAPRPAKAGPLGFRERAPAGDRGCHLAAGPALRRDFRPRRRSRRASPGRVRGGGGSQEALLGGRRPAPRELRHAVAGDPIAADERPHAARQQNGRDHRHAPRSRSKVTARNRPDNEHEAQGRDGVEEELEPQIPHGDRLVKEARRRGQSDHHQPDRTPALGERRPAEERPPDDDRRGTGEATQEPDQRGRCEAHEWRPEPDQRQKERGHHTGPQPQRPTAAGPYHGHVESDASRARLVPGRDPVKKSRGFLANGAKMCHTRAVVLKRLALTPSAFCRT